MKRLLSTLAELTLVVLGFAVLLFLLATRPAFAATVPSYALVCYTAAGAPVAPPVTTCASPQWHTPAPGQAVYTQAGTWVAFTTTGTVAIAQCAQAGIGPGKLQAACTSITYALPCKATGQTCAAAPVPTTATLSWTAPTLDTSGNALPAGTTLTYNVYRGATSAALTLLKNVSTLSTTDTVTIGGTYWYAVSAMNGAQEGPKSTAVSAALSAGTVVSPAPPTGLTIK